MRPVSLTEEPKGNPAGTSAAHGIQAMRVGRSGEQSTEKSLDPAAGSRLTRLDLDDLFGVRQWFQLGDVWRLGSFHNPGARLALHRIAKQRHPQVETEHLKPHSIVHLYPPSTTAIPPSGRCILRPLQPACFRSLSPLYSLSSTRTSSSGTPFSLYLQAVHRGTIELPIVSVLESAPRRCDDASAV
jgi:hypothetical protein